jgi:hypothetical protein
MNLEETLAMPYNPKLKERQGISTDERRAKVKAITAKLLECGSINQVEFEQKWIKFLAEKVREGKDIAGEFINRWNEF